MPELYADVSTDHAKGDNERLAAQADSYMSILSALDQLEAAMQASQRNNEPATALPGSPVADLSGIEQLQAAIQASQSDEESMIAKSRTNTFDSSGLERLQAETQASQGFSEPLTTNTGSKLSHLSSLERLPAEMRSRIYVLAVADDCELDLARAAKQPALAATNTFIRSEVLPVYYGENVFTVDISIHEDKFKTTKPQKYIDNFAKYTKLMKCVGALNSAPPPRPFGIDIPKLHVYIDKNRITKVTFQGLRSPTPQCVCSLMKIIRDQEEKNVDDLQARLLLASGTDLAKMMFEVSWKEFSVSNVSQLNYQAQLLLLGEWIWNPWKAPVEPESATHIADDFQPGTTGSDCENCKEFRGRELFG